MSSSQKCPNCGHIITTPPADYLADIPTKKQFDQWHKDPQGYGDEDDWLLVSRKYSAEEALEKIQHTMRKDWGWSDDEGHFPHSIDDLTIYNIGWGPGVDDPGGAYWICTGTNTITPRWQAWGVVTQ